MRNHITGRGALVRKLSGRARTVLGDGSKGDGCSQGRNIGGNRCTEKRRCYGDTAVGVGGVWGYEKKTPQPRKRNRESACVPRKSTGPEGPSHAEYPESPPPALRDWAEGRCTEGLWGLGENDDAAAEVSGGGQPCASHAGPREQIAAPRKEGECGSVGREDRP